MSSENADTQQRVQTLIMQQCAELKRFFTAFVRFALRVFQNTTPFSDYKTIVGKPNVVILATNECENVRFFGDLQI